VSAKPMWQMGHSAGQSWSLHKESRGRGAINAHVLHADSFSELPQGSEDSNEVAMAVTKKEQGRHDIEELLPWHAAGTLSRREADRVEEALAGDRELRRRYELARRELAQTVYLNETLGAPSMRAMEKLFAAIDAEETSAPRRPLRRRRIQPNAILRSAPARRRS
jgi:hypothetical protein